MTESPLPDHLARLPPANSIPPLDNSCLTLPSPLSAMEATYYYAGLRPPPILVARSSKTPWEPPSGPNAEWNLQELGPVRHEALSEAWEGGLIQEVIALLHSMDVEYTSARTVCFKPEADDTIYAPVRVVVWIGVRPKSLCGDDGVVVVSKCKELIEKHNITDVEVEICELALVRWDTDNVDYKKSRKLGKKGRRQEERWAAERLAKAGSTPSGRFA